jgi:hypothetical protein
MQLSTRLHIPESIYAYNIWYLSNLQQILMELERASILQAISPTTKVLISTTLEKLILEYFGKLFQQ